MMTSISHAGIARMAADKDDKPKKKFAFVSAAAQREFTKLPKGIQSQFGNDLHAVQCGQRPYSEFKDISASVGGGAMELIENGSPAYRTVYCAKYMDTVFVLHAFTKTTNGVDGQAMDTAEKRYKDMMSQIAEHKKAARKAASKSK